MLLKITSKNSQMYKGLVALGKNRDHHDLILMEGEDLVEEAYSMDLLHYVLVEDEEKVFHPDEVKNIVLSHSLFRSLASFKSLPKIMGVAAVSQAEKVSGNLIYLDGVQDPGNVGTIIRTALALGYDGLVLSPDSAYPFSAKVIQSSKGAIFKLPIMVKDIKDFDNLEDYEIIGTMLNGEVLSTPKRSEKPLMLVFGNEGHGIRKEVSDLLSKAYLIPMNSIDSLNVAIAAGIFMYIFRR